MHTFVRVNVLIVVTLFSLGAGGEERTVGNLLTLLQAFLELDTVNSTRALVLCPATAGDVTSNNSLDREDLCALDEHGATLYMLLDIVKLLLELSWKLSIVGSDDVRLDERWCQKTEPEGGEGVKKLALVGDSLSPSKSIILRVKI